MSADPESHVSPGRAAAVSPGAPPVRDPTRYELIGEHGRGGLGRVSRVHDKDFGRDIAIKELIARSHVNEVRFAREAMITARLEHPGIVPVYETGRWPDGTPFYAMKLIAGRSLRALISERTTVDARLGLLHHVIAVADTIAYAHGRSVIHRDLKPANVIVGDFGETVVIDWGLAKDLSESVDLPRGSDGARSSDDGLTSAGSILGTPTYMAPEQERGEAVDQRADVFAIGAMLWELCSLQKVPLAPRARLLRKAGIDADLITIIDKALDPAPDRRYRDAGALAADLNAFKSGARIAAREYSPWAMLAHWTRRHRALAGSVTAALVVAVASAIGVVRNIAVERDRADAALVSAQHERDRAKLSEAALLVDRDPNRARDLLASLPSRTPQIALLTSRARQQSATLVVQVSDLAGWPASPMARSIYACGTARFDASIPGPAWCRRWRAIRRRPTRIATASGSRTRARGQARRRRILRSPARRTRSVWSRQGNEIVQVHHHAGYSFGLEWMRGMICSGSFGDGQLMCSSPTGDRHEVTDWGARRIAAMTATPDHRTLVLADEAGTVRRFDGSMRVLYTHDLSVDHTRISGDGQLIASTAEDGSFAVFDLTQNKLIASMHAHAHAKCDVSWRGDELWSAGLEGTVKQWSVRDDALRLQHVVQLAGPVRSLAAVGHGWVAIVGTGELVISRDGATTAVRLDAGRAIAAIDVSSDQRYVAATTNGEIIVIDLLRRAVATMATGAPVQQLTFLEPGLLAYSEPMALKTLRVEQLDYVPYDETPEPANRASF